MEPSLFSSTKQRLSTKRFLLKLAIDETSFKFVNKELHMMGGNTPRNGGIVLAFKYVFRRLSP